MIDDVATAVLDILLFRWLYSHDSGVPRWLAVAITLIVLSAIAFAVWFFVLR